MSLIESQSSAPVKVIRPVLYRRILCYVGFVLWILVAFFILLMGPSNGFKNPIHVSDIWAISEQHIFPLIVLVTPFVLLRVLRIATYRIELSDEKIVARSLLMRRELQKNEIESQYTKNDEFGFLVVLYPANKKKRRIFIRSRAVSFLGPYIIGRYFSVEDETRLLAFAKDIKTKEDTVIDKRIAVFAVCVMAIWGLVLLVNGIIGWF